MKVTLATYRDDNILTLLIDGLDKYETRILMPLNQVMRIVQQRGQGIIITTRTEERTPRKITSFRLVVQAQRRWGDVLRLVDDNEVDFGGECPAVGILRLKDVQAVFPKA